MDAPQSLDCAFDFPVAEPEPKPVPEEAPVEEVDDEWPMAPVMPPSMPAVLTPSTFEVGEPSTAAPEIPFPVGRPLPEVVSSVAVHHKEIGGLFVWTENLEHAHGMLVRKMGEGQVGVLASQHEQVMTKVGEVEDQVLETQDKVNNYPSGHVDGLRKDVDGLLGLKEQVQTLKSTIQELKKENQKLRGLLSVREGDHSVLASYLLGLGERLAMMELQFPGPPPGPQ
ncbi:hypothetical protein Tco_1274341 [Tanacetum coccineum]